VFAQLDRLAELGHFEELIRTARAALEPAALEQPPEERVDDGIDAALDLNHYLSWAFFQLNDFEAALDHARAAQDPLDEAKALFHLWRFDETRAALDECDDDAEAQWYRALLAEFTGGDFHEARRRAIELEPSRYRAPAHLDGATIDRVVSDALDELPGHLAMIAQEAVVEVLPLPAPHPDVDPLTLGLYVGQDIASRSHADGIRFPPRIEIYSSNIERIADSAEHATEELRITLLHELGHHFGFDEEDMQRLGLE